MGIAEAAVDENFSANLNWARGIARKAARKLPPSFCLDDLEQAALIGLWKATQRFDPGRGVPFQAAAILWVRGQISMSVRRRNYVAATCEDLENIPIQVDPRPSPERELLEKEDRRNRTGRRDRHRRKWLRDQISLLPPAEAYLMRSVVGGADLRELAKLWNVPYAEMSRRLGSALRRLKAVQRVAGPG